jgi:hypothetical protein
MIKFSRDDLDFINFIIIEQRKNNKKLCGYNTAEKTDDYIAQTNKKSTTKRKNPDYGKPIYTKNVRQHTENNQNEAKQK